MALNAIDYAMTHKDDSPENYVTIVPEMEKDQIEFTWFAFDVLLQNIRKRASTARSH